MQKQQDTDVRDPLKGLLSEWRENVGRVIEGDDPFGVPAKRPNNVTVEALVRFSTKCGAISTTRYRDMKSHEGSLQRNAVWYISKTMMAYSFTQIAQATGADRSGVAAGVRRMDAAINAIPRTKRQQRYVEAYDTVLAVYQKLEAV